MNNTVMKDAAKAENAFTSDETMRYKYMLREKAIRDYYSGLDDAKQAGIEIGEKRGEERGRKMGIKQGLEQGLAQGREQGLVQGREQGLAQGREQGLVQGREQGLAQGREQGERQAIMGMLRHHWEPEYIAQILQCPVEKIERIAKEYQLESD